MSPEEAKALIILHAHMPRGDAGAGWCENCKKHVGRRTEHLLEMLKLEGLEVTKRVD